VSRVWNSSPADHACISFPIAEACTHHLTCPPAFFVKEFTFCRLRISEWRTGLGCRQHFFVQSVGFADYNGRQSYLREIFRVLRNQGLTILCR